MPLWGRHKTWAFARAALTQGMHHLARLGVGRDGLGRGKLWQECLLPEHALKGVQIQHDALVEWYQWGNSTAVSIAPDAKDHVTNCSILAHSLDPCSSPRGIIVVPPYSFTIPDTQGREPDLGINKSDLFSW